MKNCLIIAFAAAFVFIGVSAYPQQNVILDTDSAKPFEGFSRYFLTPTQAEKLPGTGQVQEGDGVFKIVKVTNIQGNNPFNPIQPVYNFGGVLVANVDDLIECVRGGTCQSQGTGSGSIICSPNSGTSDTANLKDSVGCYIKGNGTICRVERLPSVADLKYESLFVMYDNFMAMSTIAGTDSTSDYKMTKPPSSSSVVWSGGTTVYKISSGTYVTEVQHKSSGVKYRINFTVTNLPGNNVRLTVNSVTRI